MQENMLLPQNEPSLKKAWKVWKGIVLAVFLLAIVFNRWLPDLLVILCYLAGIIVIVNLLFHLLRDLKNRFFWRVRHRILGSFIFVGFIPLLAICGIVYLSGYLLLGQLSAHYLDSSLRELEQEVARINERLAQQISLPVSDAAFRKAAEKEFGRHTAEFQTLAAILMRKRQDGLFQIIGLYDSNEIVKESAAPAAGKLLQNKPAFDGLILMKQAGFLASLQSLPAVNDHYLAVLAPLDKHVGERLQEEKSIYVRLIGMGRATVRKDKHGITVRVPDNNARQEIVDFESQNSDFIERGKTQTRQMIAGQLKTDARRMITWGSVLEGKDYLSGEVAPVALSIIRVPLETLYQVYLSGTGNYGAGQAILTGIIVLLIIFVLAELVSVLIGIVISRRVTRSVHDMYLGTLALKNGDLQYQIPVRKKDQLGLLAHSFNQMSASITRLLEEVSEKKLLEQELDIAREVQAALFPKQLPHPRGLSLFGGCQPARVVSGDYYDFIHEDDARLHIIVGDISGKGISAALLMANLQAAMRNQLSTFRNADPAEVERRLSSIMGEINTQIFLSSPAEKYATLFAGRYDAETRRLCYCNAGHLAPVLLSDGKIKRLEANSTVLGLFEAAAYQASSIELDPGTVLAIFTDGITEAVNNADVEFGEERFIGALRKSATNSPEVIYQYITEQVRLWQGSLKQHDDITLIIGKVE